MKNRFLKYIFYCIILLTDSIIIYNYLNNKKVYFIHSTNNKIYSLSPISLGQIFLIIFCVFTLFITLILIIFSISKQIKENKENKERENDILRFTRYRQKYILLFEKRYNKKNDFDEKNFSLKAYDMFKSIHIAFMLFDYNKLKELLTPLLYNVYIDNLELLKQQNQKNIMKKFELVNSKVIDFKNENDKYIVKVELNIKFYGYIMDISTKQILKGTDKVKLNNIYILTFESNNGIDWLLSKKEKISSDKE